MAQGKLYSTTVAWLKLLLPLAALGILSSVVFFAREADDQRTIPFVTQDGGPETPDQRLTDPEYVGLTSDGATVTLRARQVVPVGGDLQILDATTLTAVIEATDGRLLESAAPAARIDTRAGLATFLGEVDVVTSDGFRVVTQDLDVRLDNTFAESPGPVVGTAPFGRLDAGTMRYTAPDAARTVLVFNGGVKLVYQPGATRGQP